MKKVDHADSVFIFLRKSYQDTLKLLSLAEHYYNANGKRDKELLSANDKLSYTLIMSDITVKLTSALSWLLFMRAVEEGEVEIDLEKLEEYSIPTIDENLNEEITNLNIFPTPVRNLFTKSSDIYTRVKRLEKQIKENPENIMVGA